MQCSAYKILLITSEDILINVGDKDIFLKQGDLMLLRPKDRFLIKGENGTYMCMEFPSEDVKTLIQYLECESHTLEFEEKSIILPFHLTNKEYLSLKQKIDGIFLYEMRGHENALALKKILLLEIVQKFGERELYVDQTAYEKLPEWLAEALKEWDSAENRQKGLEFFCEVSGFSKEHICRSFKRYLGVSPTVYLNKQRLNCAIGLMNNKDYSMIDIAFEAGFKSSSRFYHLFRETYGVSPRQFFDGKYENGKE